MHVGFWWESQKEREQQKNLHIGGRIILKCILVWGGMDWIDLAQDRDQRRALVNTVMSLWVS
jgi:hypothetical protein